MTAEHDALRTSIIAAVQAELERHGRAVLADAEQARADAVRDRNQLRAQLASLTTAFDDLRVRHDKTLETLKALQSQAGKGFDADAQLAVRQLVDQRVIEVETRVGRRIENVNTSVDALVETAARPLLQEVRDDQEVLGARIDNVDANLRRFDEQAARMVTYFNDVTQALESKAEQLSSQLAGDVEGRLQAMMARLDEAEANALRHQGEMTQMASHRIAEVEDRTNARILAAETRAKEDAGTKIAEIDAHLGRVGSGLDDALNVINDRMAELDARFGHTDAHIEGLRREVEKVDTEAIDRLKEQLSSAAGEAMLVRIEMERVEKLATERIEGIGVRVTDLEVQLADQTMDVGTAVQLERLEELERAVMEIDPNKFVVKPEFADDDDDDESSDASLNASISID